MERKHIQQAPISIDDCGMAITAQLFGDKWSLLILREIFYGVTRFADIQADIIIPKAVLSKRLKHLLDAGVLTREKYQEPNNRARYSYALTDSGRELAVPLLAMMAWGDKHKRNGNPSLRLSSKNTGNTLKVALVDSAHQETPLTDIHLSLSIKDNAPD